MNKLKAHLKCLKYWVRHKYFVFKAGRNLGVQPWQLLIHDISKLHPQEWIPYANYFAALPATGKWGMHQAGTNPEFDKAWEHHWKNNPHHFQFWILHPQDNATHAALADLMSEENRALAYAGKMAIPMPDKFIREMIADWKGAGLARNEPDVVQWYKDNKAKMNMHLVTKIRIEQILGIYPYKE